MLSSQTTLAAVLAMASFFRMDLAHAQAATEYPSRPVTIVVPAPPGGVYDGLARALAIPLARAQKQPVIVDNQGGAAVVSGTGHVAKAAADGHTLLLTGDSHPVSSMLYKLPYDPVKDFVPVSPISTWPLILITAPTVSARTLPELVALAKSKPGYLSYASTGTGTSSQLTAEMFKAEAGIFVTHIPYRGGAPAIQDVMGGQVHFMMIGAGTALQHVRSGKVNALAVTSSERIPSLPNVPAVSAYYPKFESLAWIGMFAPAGTSPAIVGRLNAEVGKAVQAPEVRAYLEAQAMSPRVGSAAQFDSLVKDEARKWGALINRLNIKLE